MDHHLKRAAALYHIPSSEVLGGGLDLLSSCAFFDFPMPARIEVYAAQDNDHLWEDGRSIKWETVRLDWGASIGVHNTIVGWDEYVGTKGGVQSHELCHYFQVISTPTLIQLSVLAGLALAELKDQIHRLPKQKPIQVPIQVDSSTCRWIPQFVEHYRLALGTQSYFGITLHDILEGQASYVQFVRTPHPSIAGPLEKFYRTLERQIGIDNSYVKLHKVLTNVFNEDAATLLPVLARAALTSVDDAGGLPTPPAILDALIVILIKDSKLRKTLIDTCVMDPAAAYILLQKRLFDFLNRSASGLALSLRTIFGPQSAQIEAFIPSTAIFRRFLSDEPDRWASRLCVLPYEQKGYLEWIEKIELPDSVFNFHSPDKRTIAGTGRTIAQHAFVGMLLQLLIGGPPRPHCPHRDCPYWSKGMCNNYLLFPANHEQCELPEAFNRLFEVCLCDVVDSV